MMSYIRIIIYLVLIIALYIVILIRIIKHDKFIQSSSKQQIKLYFTDSIFIALFAIAIAEEAEAEAEAETYIRHDVVDLCCVREA